MSIARVRRIAGPVLEARAEGPFFLRESVRVGPAGLLGEVVRIDGDGITAQVYEDTTGLKPGTLVEGEGTALAIRLGPALLGGIFDGLLRPMDARERHLPPGRRARPAQRFAFEPLLAPGTALEGGERLGRVLREGRRPLHALVPPTLAGTLSTIRGAGEVTDEETVAVVREAGGREVTVALSHDWPVRTPRPVRHRLDTGEPLVTGQRVLDSLFPVALGGKAAIPGGFGTGKTVLLEALAKGCAADVIVYLGCGERGNEMAGVLEEFPRLDDPRTGRALMERTVIVANTSNMPVAAREASIYSAITVAEYFRDQGLHVALLADSTSRWAEALREVSGRFGELPGEGGYPAYLASRLAQFYERAGLARTLAGGTGSVTVLGAISPPSGDFSEPVTSHTKRYVRAFWALDAKRAQARFYPAVHPLQSYAEGAETFAAWWGERGNPQWAQLRRRFLTLLDEQSRLERMARIIGKDALPPRQQVTLLCAELVNEAFLRQSAFSAKDRVAGPAKQAAMMRLAGRFIDLAFEALAAGAAPAAIAALPVVRTLSRLGEEAGDGEDTLFAEAAAALETAFRALLPVPAERHEAPADR